MLGEFIRNKIFWILDFIKGGKVKKYQKIIQYTMNNKCTNYERTDEILSYVNQNIPFYKRNNFKSFENYPVMTKKDYMQNLSDFLLDGINLNKLHKVETSGSTGVPFIGYQDKNKRIKHTADLIYFHGKCGYKIGDKYIFLRAWTSLYNNSKLQQIKNNVISYNVMDLSEEKIEEIVKKIKKNKKIKMILGYGSALGLIAEYLLQNNLFLKTGIKVIISDSDKLKLKHRKILSERLNCKVVDRYSNEEHGLLAFSYDFGEPYEVNRSSYRIEILKIDSNQYAEKGEIGRIVITDLYNKAMPLIRYDLGDLAICDDDPRDAHFLKELQGRSADKILRNDGVYISSATVNNYFEALKNVKQYQLIQKDSNSFVLKVVERNEYVYSDACYYNILTEIFGGSCNLEVQRLLNIPLENSGKFRPVIGIKK